MRVLLAILILAVGALVRCGAGPTAPSVSAAPAQATPVPTREPTPLATPALPCRPYPKCLK